jgi:hypothetical protein
MESAAFFSANAGLAAGAAALEAGEPAGLAAVVEVETAGLAAVVEAAPAAGLAAVVDAFGAVLPAGLEVVVEGFVPDWVWACKPFTATKERAMHRPDRYVFMLYFFMKKANTDSKKNTDTRAKIRIIPL